MAFIPSAVLESRAVTLPSTVVTFRSRVSRISFISPSLVSIRAVSASDDVLTLLATYFFVAHPLVATSVADITRNIDSLCMCFLFLGNRRIEAGTPMDLAKRLPFDDPERNHAQVPKFLSEPLVSCANAGELGGLGVCPEVPKPWKISRITAVSAGRRRSSLTGPVRSSAA